MHDSPTCKPLPYACSARTVLVPAGRQSNGLRGLLQVTPRKTDGLETYPGEITPMVYPCPGQGRVDPVGSRTNRAITGGAV
jgi:hypothetical protein